MPDIPFRVYLLVVILLVLIIILARTLARAPIYQFCIFCQEDCPAEGMVPVAKDKNVRQCCGHPRCLDKAKNLGYEQVKT